MLWLERKYLSMVMANLDRSKWVNENTLNHRCPYCGDSQKNVYKARGYHFVKEQSFIFKCHNCSKTTSSVNFLKENGLTQVYNGGSWINVQTMLDS